MNKKEPSSSKESGARRRRRRPRRSGSQQINKSPLNQSRPSVSKPDTASATLFSAQLPNKRPYRKSRPDSKWNRYRISEHFVKRDFDSRKKDCSCSQSLRISLGLVGVIEAIRAQIGKKITICTGYYCPECRTQKYGIKRDVHPQGIAADIQVPDMSIYELFQIAETFPDIKGLGLNIDNNHVHIDTRKTAERELWVESNGDWIPLTDANRADYFPATPSNDGVADTSPANPGDRVADSPDHPVNTNNSHDLSTDSAV